MKRVIYFLTKSYKILYKIVYSIICVLGLFLILYGPAIIITGGETSCGIGDCLLLSGPLISIVCYLILYWLYGIIRMICFITKESIKHYIKWLIS